MLMVVAWDNEMRNLNLYQKVALTDLAMMLTVDVILSLHRRFSGSINRI